MSPLGVDDVLAPAEHVVARDFGAAVALVSFADGAYAELNATGARVWRAVAARRPLGTAAAEIAASFGVAQEKVAGDVLALAGELVALGVATRVTS